MENDEDRWKMPHYSPLGSTGADLSWKRWSKIVVPGEDAKHSGSHRHDSKEDEKKRTYYAQVKYNGEWGYSRGGGGGDR